MNPSPLPTGINETNRPPFGRQLKEDPKPVSTDTAAAGQGLDQRTIELSSSNDSSVKQYWGVYPWEITGSPGDLYLEEPG